MTVILVIMMKMIMAVTMMMMLKHLILILNNRGRKILQRESESWVRNILRGAWESPAIQYVLTEQESRMIRSILEGELESLTI